MNEPRAIPSSMTKQPSSNGSGPPPIPEAALFRPFEAGCPDQPFVIAQLGQSLDGRIATLSGDSKYINGAAGLDHLHRLRSRVDAVVVGVGTVLADDPLLTVRRVDGRSPARVVIDPQARSSPDARCFAEDGTVRLLVCGPAAGPSHPVEQIRLPAPAGRFCPRAIVTALGRRGFRRILIEGGAQTISRFMDAGCVDRLHVLLTPMILGSGRPALDLAPIATLDQALRPRTGIHLLGDGDVLFDCDLRAQTGPS